MQMPSGSYFKRLIIRIILCIVLEENKDRNILDNFFWQNNLIIFSFVDIFLQKMKRITGLKTFIISFSNID